MTWLRWIVDGLGYLRDIVVGVKDARAKSVDDALEATAAGRAAHDAAERAGK